MDPLTEEQIRLTIVGVFIVVFVFLARCLEYYQLKNKKKKVS
jgi:hypothetical protein